MERILTMLAVQASGQNPDLTTWPGPVPSGTYEQGAARIIYVGPAGNDANAGTILSLPKLTIGAAVTALGGAGKVVFVGTLVPTATITITGASGLEIEGIGPGFSVIQAGATVTDLLRIVNSSNVTLRDFKLQVGATFTATNALQITQSAGSTEQVVVTNVWATNGSGTMTNGFAVGTDTNGDVSQITFVGCEASGAAAAGFRCGNGTAGNVYDIHAIGCTARNGAYGVYCDGSALTWDGGDFLGNSTSDWYVGTVAVNAPCSASNFHSESSNRFLLTAGPSTAALHFSISQAVWVGNSLNADGKWINNLAGGSLTLLGVKAYGAASMTIAAQNVAVTAAGFESTSAVASVVSASVVTTLIGYVQRSTDGTTVTGSQAFWSSGGTSGGIITTGQYINASNASPANIQFNSSGIVINGRMGFSGVSPPVQPATPAAATDLASVITLANAIRGALSAANGGNGMMA